MNVTVNRITKGIAIFNSKDPPLNTTCTGYEPSFASIEICEVNVMGCSFQQYGENCTSCPLKCLNQECDAFYGSCIYGCSDRLLEPPDCMVCKAGYYGHNCEQTCGNCKSGTVCDNNTGICPEGCKSHWSGSKCDVCENGFYGDNCTGTCGHCKSGTYCNKLTGICEEGCDDHWDGSTCNMCKNGSYGDNCTKTCGRCKPLTYCHNVTGICLEGCDDHWNGSQCNECRAGFFERGCEKPFGGCKNGTFCDTITGKCPEGCQGDWIEINCNVLSSPGDTKAGEGTSNTSSVVISVLATLLVVIVTYLLVRFLKNKWKEWKRGKNEEYNLPTKLVDNPQSYDQISGTQENHVYQEINSAITDYEEIHKNSNHVF